MADDGLFAHAHETLHDGDVSVYLVRLWHALAEFLSYSFAFLPSDRSPLFVRAHCVAVLVAAHLVHALVASHYVRALVAALYFRPP